MEPKRLSLQPVNDGDHSKKESSQRKDSSNAKKLDTVRLEIDLTKPTQHNYIEVSYAQLLKEYSAMQKSIDDSDPFAREDLAEDDKLKKIAENFEKKYGKSSASSKELRDLVDIGEGYDLDDPFIDNTEVYDEVVPYNMSTKLGGFYINSGTLDFTLHPEDKSATVKKKKKRKLVLPEFDDRTLKKKKKKHFQPEKTAQQSSSSTKSDVVKKNESIPSDTGQKAPADEETEKNNSVKVMQDVTCKIDAGTENKLKVEPPPPLPDTLPLQLVGSIDKLKEAAKKLKEEGKNKAFTDEMNKALLSVEQDVRRLKIGERSTIYNHLAGHLPCSKETLVKRAKKLLSGQQEDQLREPMNKLKQSIAAVMPPQLEKHQLECQAKEQERQDRQAEEKQKVVQKEGTATDSEEDEEAEAAASKQKRIIAPRKKFEWTPLVRSLLMEVVQIKLEQFEKLNIKGQTAEEYLRQFLDSEVRVLWPAGWMQTRILLKESKTIHARWTTNILKNKKPAASSSSAAAASAKSVFGLLAEQQEKTEEAAPSVLDIAEMKFANVAKSHSSHQTKVKEETMSKINGVEQPGKTINSSETSKATSKKSAASESIISKNSATNTFNKMFEEFANSAKNLDISNQALNLTKPSVEPHKIMDTSPQRLKQNSEISQAENLKTSDKKRDNSKESSSNAILFSAEKQISDFLSQTESFPLSMPTNSLNDIFGQFPMTSNKLTNQYSKANDEGLSSYSTQVKAIDKNLALHSTHVKADDKGLASHRMQVKASEKSLISHSSQVRGNDKSPVARSATSLANYKSTSKPTSPRPSVTLAEPKLNMGLPKPFFPESLVSRDSLSTLQYPDYSPPHLLSAAQQQSILKDQISQYRNSLLPQHRTPNPHRSRAGYPETSSPRSHATYPETTSPSGRLRGSYSETTSPSGRSRGAYPEISSPGGRSEDWPISPFDASTVPVSLLAHTGASQISVHQSSGQATSPHAHLLPSAIQFPDTGNFSASNLNRLLPYAYRGPAHSNKSPYSS